MFDFRLILPDHITYRRQIDITTYQLLFFLSDTSLCLFGDDMYAIDCRTSSVLPSGDATLIWAIPTLLSIWRSYIPNTRDLGLCMMIGLTLYIVS